MLQAAKGARELAIPDLIGAATSGGKASTSVAIMVSLHSPHKLLGVSALVIVCRTSIQTHLYDILCRTVGLAD